MDKKIFVIDFADYSIKKPDKLSRIIK